MKKQSLTKSSSKNFIDLFAGAGGLSCGLEMAGWRCLLGVDSDRYAMKTFSRNHHEANTYCGDITKLDQKTLDQLIGPEKIMAVVGGPPCQGFSTVGTGNPKDQRNSLFMQFVRIVKLTSPEFVVVENVTGLLAKKNERTLKAIISQFERLGYKLNFKVMAAHEYGVPEMRRRTIIIGSKNLSHPSFPSPLYDNSKRPYLTVSEALKDITGIDGKLYNHDLEQAQVLSSLDKKRLACIPEGRGIRYEKDEKEFFKSSKLKLGINWAELPEGRFRQTRYYRLDGKKPSPTIMTHRHSYYHPTEHRFLTQREAARLQSFPNEFVFEGPLSAQWRQIGNAVPPLLGKAIGQELNKMLKKIKTMNKSPEDSLPKARKKKALTSKVLELRKNAFRYREESL